MKIKLYEATAYIQGKSTTSVAVGTGTKTFVLTSDIVFIPNMEVEAIYPDSSGTDIMTGTVVSYTRSTKTLVLNITSTSGSGTHAAWTIGGEHTFRWTTGEGFVTKKAETPSLAKYRPSVLNAGFIDRNLWGVGTTYGTPEVGSGVVSISNANREYDALIDYCFDGRPLVIREGLSTAAYPSGFTTLFYGTIQKVEHSWRTINFQVLDRLGEIFSKPVQTVRYLGNNSLPNGVEGVAADLLGKPKPVLKGKAENFAPPMVNTSKQTFEVNWRQVASIDTVYHGGEVVSLGTTHASLADLQAATVSASTYDRYLGSSSEGAYIRLGSAVTKTVTVDATEGSSASDRTAAQIAKWFLTNPGGIASGDVNAASVTALDTANNSVVGIWIGPEERTVGDCIFPILESVGGFLTLNRAGEFIVGRLELPTGTAETEFTSFHIADQGNGVELLGSNDQNEGLAVPYCILNYRKNFTIQNEAEITAAAITRFGFAGQEFRKVTSTEDEDVNTRSLLAKPMEFFTLLTNQTNAQTEVDRRGVIYKDRRDTVRIRVANNYTSDLELNSIVSLNIPAYTWDGGKKFRIIGMTDDFTNNKTTLTLWG